MREPFVFDDRLWECVDLPRVVAVSAAVVARRLEIERQRSGELRSAISFFSDQDAGSPVFGGILFLAALEAEFPRERRLLCVLGIEEKPRVKDLIGQHEAPLRLRDHTGGNLQSTVPKVDRQLRVSSDAAAEGE